MHVAANKIFVYLPYFFLTVKIYFTFENYQFSAGVTQPIGSLKSDLPMKPHFITCGKSIVSPPTMNDYEFIECCSSLGLYSCR